MFHYLKDKPISLNCEANSFKEQSNYDIVNDNLFILQNKVLMF